MKIRKIVTLDPASTELVSFLDEGSYRIAGVSDKCDFPPEVKSKPKVVRSLMKINEEMSSFEIDREVKRYLESGNPIYEIDWNTIREIEPDLLVGQSICGVCAFPINSLYKISIDNYNVYDYSPKNFFEIFHKGYELGKIIDRENKARAFLESYHLLEEELRGLGRFKKIVMIEWIMPIYVAGLWVSQIIETCGARSLLRAGEEGREIEWEVIRSFDPDIVLISPCGFGIERTLREIDILFALPGWKEMRAYLNKQIYVVDSAYTSRPSPRTIEFARALMDALTGNEPRREIMMRIE